MLTANISAVGQDRAIPKLIKSKGTYNHSLSNSSFPESLFEFPRLSIYSFSKSDDNIQVTYGDKFKTIFSIAIYDGGEGSEERLRDEYYKSLSNTATIENKVLKYENMVVKKTGAQYICTGLKGVKEDNSNNWSSRIIIYECGTWFLKLLITSSTHDSSGLEELEKSIFEKYDPTSLTGSGKLKVRTEFIVAPGLKASGDLAACILKSGIAKLEWIKDNIPDKERVSGFPGLYLGIYLKELEILGSCDYTNPGTDKQTILYVEYIKKLKKAGLLAEFILDEKKFPLFFDQDVKIDMEAYDKFVAQNPYPKIDKNRFYYVIVAKKE